MAMLNLRETISKLKESGDLKRIENQMDRSGKKGGYHPEDCGLFNSMGQADLNEVRETLQNVPFYTFMNKMKEFLGTSGTTGISGAAYLVPVKIYDVLFRSAWASDLTARAYRMADAPGATLKVDYSVTGQYRPHAIGSGGSSPQETLQFGQATVTPQIYSINAAITNELIEDSQWDTVQVHLEEAAKACAELSTGLSIAVLVAAANGDGTLNTLTTGATGITDFQDMMDAWATNADDGYFSNTIVTNPFAIADFSSDASVSAYANQYHDRQVTDPPMVQGTFKGMEILCLSGEKAYYATYASNILYSGSVWRTLVYDKENAGVCLRKRWLKIDNYSDPVNDLEGAVISFREGYSTVNKDAICLVSENSG
jgi:hypothetical protein